MTKYNTGNPVGSADPRDLYDNAKVFDEQVNNVSSPTVNDRFGRARVTLANQLGYTFKGDYSAGITLNNYNDYIRYDGEFYGPAASATLPYTTTATLPDADSNLVGRGDAVLRQELASSPSGGNAGSLLVNGVTHAVSSRAAMKTYDVPPGTQFSLEERGKFGSFVVKSGTPPSDSDEAAIVPMDNGNYAERLTVTGELLAEWGGTTKAAVETLIERLNNGTDYTGGQVRIPVGKNTVSAQINIDSDNPNNINGAYLKGYSKQGSNLWFESAPVTDNGVELRTAQFTGVEDLAIYKAPLAGLVIKTGPVWSHVKVRDVRIGFNGTTGVIAERGFLGDFTQVMSDHNALHGFDFEGLHTSLHIANCYAVSNTSSGYKLNQLTYSAMIGCASDSNGQFGYQITKSHTLAISGTGSEDNGRAGFYLTSSAALGANENISLDSVFGVQNNGSNSGWANLLHLKASDGATNTAMLTNSKGQDPANPIEDVIVEGEGSYLVEGYNSLPNGIIARNRGYIQHLPKVTVIRDKSVTAATALVDLIGTQGTTNGYGGEITVVASNADPATGSLRNTATYKLLIDKGAGGSNLAEIAKVGLTTGGSATHPSFTFSISGNRLSVTPVGSTSGTFFFEIFTSGGLKVGSVV